MKTPEEIKNGLVEAMEETSWVVEGGDAHDLQDACDMAHASMADAMAYIQQLEAERDALLHWARGRCDTCDHNDDCVRHEPDPEGYIVHWYDDCEVWEWRGVKEEG